MKKEKHLKGYAPLLLDEDHVQTTGIKLHELTQVNIRMVGKEPGKDFQTDAATVRIMLKSPTGRDIILFDRISIPVEHVSRHDVLKSTLLGCHNRASSRDRFLWLVASTTVIDISPDDKEGYVRLNATLFDTRPPGSPVTLVKPIQRSTSIHQNYLLGAFVTHALTHCSY